MAYPFIYSGTSCFNNQIGTIGSDIPLTIGGVYATDDSTVPCVTVLGLYTGEGKFGSFGIGTNDKINGSTVTPIPYSSITTGDLTLYDQNSIGFDNIEWDFPNPFGNFYFFTQNTPQIYVLSNGILNFDSYYDGCCFYQNYPGNSLSPEFGQKGIFISEYGDVDNDNDALIYSIYTGYTNSNQNFVIQLQGTYLNDFTLPFGSENLVYSYIFHNSNQNIVDLVIQYNPHGGLVRPLGGVGSPVSLNYSSTFSGTSGTAFRINANTGYDSCLSCMQGYSTGAYLLRDCITGEGFWVPMLIFDFVPIQNNVYYLNIVFTSDRKEYIYKGCYIFQDVRTDYYKLSETFLITLEVQTYEVSTSYGDTKFTDGCTSCLTEHTPIWLVYGCDGLNYYIPIIDTYNGEIITFIPFGEVDLFCGQVIEVSNVPFATATLISQGGFNDCTECQTNSQVKRKIINCLDGSEEVVWGSVLFGQGDVTNLNFNNSCWQVGPETEESVTINEFLDYEPSPTCQDCIQCNGVIYLLESCPPEQRWYVQSYSYVPFGTVIFHPIYGCTTVIDIQPGSGYSTSALYSFFSFETCEDCQSANIDTWWGQECIGGEWEKIATTGSTFYEGDIVKAHYGNTDYLCYRLSGDTGRVEPTDIDFYYTPDTVPYVDCTTCQENSTIAISIITCDNKQQQYVNVDLELYIEMTGLFNTYNYTPVILIDGTCWRLLTSCPIENNYLRVNPGNRYLNCTLCSLPIEVGNETIVCFEDCSGTTYTSTVNHATWTDQFGKAISLLDSIQLGGTDGYYA
jgi:hypothetical protein